MRGKQTHFLASTYSSSTKGPHEILAQTSCSQLIAHSLDNSPLCRSDIRRNPELEQQPELQQSAIGRDRAL